MQFENFDEIKTAFQESDAEIPEDTIKLAKIYVELKEQCAEIDRDLKKHKAKAAELEESLYAKLEADEVQSIAVKGKMLFRRIDTYASVDREMETAAFVWLRENGYGHLIREIANARSLTSAIKEYIEEGGSLESITDGIKLRAVNRVVVRKK